jgi:TRAP-type C4-dicarboxylate transport system substrate-binding protein
VLKYFTPINIVGPVNMVNVNLDAWNRLPEKTRKIVMEIAAEMEDEMWNLASEMDRKSRATLKAEGMTITPVSSDFRAELNKLGEQLRAEWAKKAGADAQKILDQYYSITGREK